MTRENLVAGLLLVVTFLAGLTSGIVLQQALRPNFSLPAGMSGRPPGPGGGRGQGALRPGGFDAQSLTRRLSLSAEQEEEVQRIIQEQQERMDSLLMSVRPNIEAEFRILGERIGEVLTPEQRVEFDEFVDDGFARLGARRPLPGRPGPPPFPSPP